MNIGYRNTGYWNTGDWNTGDNNTGDFNRGDKNTGDRNTGNRNTGDWNTGRWNTGNRNTGDNNTGRCNTRNENTGDRNTGRRNTGNWNTCNRETGFLNTEQSDTIRVFNKPCEVEVWKTTNIPNFMYFSLTEWKTEKKMSAVEKEENPTYKTTGGYLKKYNYKEAFIKSYEDLTEEERLLQTEQLKTLPNFDKDVFYEISGIDIDKYDKKKITIDEKDIYISNESFEEFKKQFM